MGGPTLEQDHFIFKTHDNDHGYQGGQADDEKCQNYHGRAVGQLKGRVHPGDNQDEQAEDTGKTNDTFVDGNEPEQQSFHAEGKGHKQGNVKQNTK